MLLNSAQFQLWLEVNAHQILTWHDIHHNLTLLHVINKGTDQSARQNNLATCTTISRFSSHKAEHAGLRRPTCSDTPKTGRVSYDESHVIKWCIFTPNLNSNVKVKYIFKKSGCLAPNANSSYFFDGGYSYLTQCLPEVCR